jgi:ADP-heptose:LPS heptosyltransferase
MVCLNEAAFIEPAIRSVIDYLDKIIVIEGAWGTSAKANGISRSDDGTLEILKALKEEYGDKLEVHQRNAIEQLQQRSLHFEICPEPHWMFIIDADEIYEPEEIQKVVEATKRTDAECYHTKAMTFVNDGYHYVNIDWPRLFRIDGPGYKFITPNHLIDAKGRRLTCCKDPVATYYHYSCVHPAWRMDQKIRDRIATHGEFRWEVHGKWTKRKGIAEKLQVTDHIPDLVKDHPLLVNPAPTEAFEYKEPEKIGFVIHSGMGNLILATPMLKALRMLKPEARISVLTWERGASVMHGWPVVNEVVTRDWGKFIHSIGGLDYLLVSPTSCIRDPGIFQQAKKIIEPAKKPNGWVKHEVEYNMDLVRQMGYEGETPKQEVYIPDSRNITNHKVAVISAGFLREHPWGLKSPVENIKLWIEVADALVYNGYVVFFMGCKVDCKDAGEIVQKIDRLGHAMNICGATDIKTACAIIKSADLFVGLDGGLAHVAACFDIPSVVLWTFTNPIKNVPVNKNLQLVSTPCDKRLQCQHGTYKNCPYDHKCRNINAHMVIQRLGAIHENLRSR